MAAIMNMTNGTAFFYNNNNDSSNVKRVILPCFGKRKQVTKVTFLVKERNVSVISTDVNGIS